MWQSWVDLMGDEKEKWDVNDPRFHDDWARGEQGEIVSARMSEWCKQHTMAEAISLLEAARLPCGPGNFFF